MSIAMLAAALSTARWVRSNMVWNGTNKNRESSPAFSRRLKASSRSATFLFDRSLSAANAVSNSVALVAVDRIPTYFSYMSMTLHTIAAQHFHLP